ncbi:MAG: DUF192 domain-containing protein [Firmicutes bacterium]|nr:DUF192 domain-containing protein [Bacillota bacterium]
MWLINCRTGDVIAEQVEMAGSFRGRVAGLIGKKTVPSGFALVLIPCRSIHTFFMRFDIDVIFLDRQGIVVHFIPNMPPYRIGPLVRGAYMVVELPGGAAGSRVFPGDQLNIRE